MSCPLRSQSQAVLQTCRTWSHSTSQTSSLWSSRRSSNCRVSQSKSPFISSVNICWSIDSLRSPSALLRPTDSCFLSSNDLTHTLSSYLKQGECCPKSSIIFTSEHTSHFYFLFQFVPSGPRSKSSTQRRVLWLCWSSAALLSEPSSS